MKKLLSADIGGTNSRFAYFETNVSDGLTLIETRWLKTKESSSFSHLIKMLRSEGFALKPEEADIAVIAVAGPVENNIYSAPPFISWDIDISNAGKDFGFKKSFLINDFVAQAFACRSPAGESAEKILQGKCVKDAALAVIGAGTALGKASLVSDGSGGFTAVPSEGGHANFPFVSEREYEFQKFLMKELNEEYITANYVVSGKGLSYLHAFHTGERLEPKEVVSGFNPGSETLEWAARFYGRVCRNYALEVLAYGGVYIAGGVAARTPELLRHNAFEKEFRSSKTMADILKNIPVFLIKDQESGLWGSALYGYQALKKLKYSGAK